MNNDDRFKGYAEVIGKRLGVRVDKTEKVLRSLHPIPAEAYCQLVDTLAPFNRGKGRIVATMHLVTMIRHLELGW